MQRGGGGGGEEEGGGAEVVYSRHKPKDWSAMTVEFSLIVYPGLKTIQS